MNLSREEKEVLARLEHLCDDDEQEVIDTLERLQDAVESRPWVMSA